MERPHAKNQEVAGGKIEEMSSIAEKLQEFERLRDEWPSPYETNAAWDEKREELRKAYRLTVFTAFENYLSHQDKAQLFADWDECNESWDEALGKALEEWNE